MPLTVRVLTPPDSSYPLLTLEENHALLKPILCSFGRTGTDGQRMQPIGEMFAERFVDHAVALDTRLAAKSFGHDMHGEMRIASGPRAGMPGMGVRIVRHLQFGGRETFAQESFHFGAACHAACVTQVACLHLVFMPRSKKKSSEPDISGHACSWAGCSDPGNYKAPKSRSRLNEYQWFCLPHVQAFNKNWNYFEGMNEEQIYAFQKDAVLGHRPTWKSDINPQHLERKLDEALHRFFGGKPTPEQLATLKPINGKDKQALAVLDLEHPVDSKGIKKQYRALVKKHHPDVNRGDVKAADTFKKLTDAYNHLLKHYVPSA